jgi:transcriptional regulator with XRE-family HTH domain
MNPDSTQTRMLRRAIRVAGTHAKLAEELGASPEMLAKWLAGELEPPGRVYLKALEMVVNATGGWAASRRPTDR